MSFGSTLRSFLQENVNITLTMEESEFHVGKRWIKGKSFYNNPSILRGHSTRVSGFPFWPKLCIAIASIIRIRKTVQKQYRLRLGSVLATLILRLGCDRQVIYDHQAFWALEFMSVRTVSLCKIQDFFVFIEKVLVKWHSMSPGSITKLCHKHPLAFLLCTSSFTFSNFRYITKCFHV